MDLGGEMKYSAPALRCLVCSSRLEADGVCLACFFTTATHSPLEVEEMESSRMDLPGFAAIGKVQLPCEFAHHRLVRELGVGGMGIVYEAEDLSVSLQTSPPRAAWKFPSYVRAMRIALLPFTYPST